MLSSTIKHKSPPSGASGRLRGTENLFCSTEIPSSSVVPNELGKTRDGYEQIENRRALKWEQKYCGTKALVEKTREAFLLQMAVDTRKAGALADHLHKYQQRFFKSVTEEGASAVTSKPSMALVKMSSSSALLFTEILKLHDKAAQRAEYLRKAENLLSVDAQKFDEFLRSSDAAAHDAIRVGIWYSSRLFRIFDINPNTVLNRVRSPT